MLKLFVRLGTRSKPEQLGPLRQILFHLLVEAGEQFAHRATINHFVGDGGSQARLVIEALVAAYIAAATFPVVTQQKSHFLL